MQTNRQNGINIIRILQGLPLSLPLVRLDAGGTPNHKIEAAVAWLGAHSRTAGAHSLSSGAHSLSSNPDPDPDPIQSQAGLDRCLSLLAQQESEGHMLIEPLTDSHAPIWLRAMTALRIISGRLRNRGGRYLELEYAVLRWFEWHRYLLMLGRVPSGPLTGQVILPCARKSPGTPGNAVRDAFLALANGERLSSGTGLGPRALILDESRPDTACLPLTKLIMSDPALGFGPSFTSGRLPRLISDLRFESRANGHIATFVNGLSQSGAIDSAPSCWVDYRTGRYSFNDHDPIPDLGISRFVAHVFAP